MICPYFLDVVLGTTQRTARLSRREAEPENKGKPVRNPIPPTTSAAMLGGPFLVSRQAHHGTCEMRIVIHSRALKRLAVKSTKSILE
jgi:hypothetical protein